MAAPFRTRLGRGLTVAVIGATPGIVLVLLAQFVIEGEMQLSVGAPGLILAVVGGAAGFLVGVIRAPAQRGSDPGTAS